MVTLLILLRGGIVHGVFFDLAKCFLFWSKMTLSKSSLVSIVMYDYFHYFIDVDCLPYTWIKMRGFFCYCHFSEGP